MADLGTDSSADAARSPSADGARLSVPGPLRPADMAAPPLASQSLSRRRFLLTGATTAAASGLVLVAGRTLAASPSPIAPAPTPVSAPAAPTPAPNGPPADTVVAFHSRPDLRPPVITVRATASAGSESLFVAPRYGGTGPGVMIADADGELVWLHRVPGRSATGIQPIQFRGGPAFWWWEGVIEAGLGDGEFVIMDATYREISRVRAVARPADLHDLQLTDRGTAYLFAMDRTVRGGVEIHDMLVQEVDAETGRLAWEWRASDHIALDEATMPPPAEGAWDYIHLNSIGLDQDGDLLLSARHTDAIYKVSRATGAIVWRLGGVRSDFALRPEAVFRRQHDARRQADGTLSLFDNATSDAQDPSARPRGLTFQLDELAGTATVVRELRPPRPVDSSSQGNLSITDDGRATIGWGSGNLVTGYDASGTVAYDAAMPPGFSSYRAFRSLWTGRPIDAPVAVVEPGTDGALAWVSWNGATGIADWELLAGEDPEALRPAGRRPRRRALAAMPRSPVAAVVAVQALDVSGHILGRSNVIVVAEAEAEARAGRQG